jgi:hypothetical protein
LRSPEIVIEVADDKVFETKLEQNLQQNAGVDPAGYANEVTLISRESRSRKRLAYAPEPMRSNRSARWHTSPKIMEHGERENDQALKGDCF